MIMQRLPLTPGTSDVPLPNAVLRWLAAAALLCGGYGLLTMSAATVVRMVRSRQWTLFPPSWWDVILVLVTAAGCCWVWGGFGLFRHRRWSPPVLRVGAVLWLGATLSYGWLDARVLSAAGDPWHVVLSQVISHVGSLGYGLLFGGAVVVVLRHESIRSTFATPTRGFQPVIGGEHVS